jgi:hypothetical protein
MGIFDDEDEQAKAERAEQPDLDLLVYELRGVRYDVTRCIDLARAIGTMGVLWTEARLEAWHHKRMLERSKQARQVVETPVLDAAILEKEEHVVTLNRAIHERDEVLRTLDMKIVEKEEVLKTIDATIQERRIGTADTVDDNTVRIGMSMDTGNVISVFPQTLEGLLLKKVKAGIKLFHKQLTARAPKPPKKDDLVYSHGEFVPRSELDSHKH